MEEIKQNPIQSSVTERSSRREKGIRAKSGAIGVLAFGAVAVGALAVGGLAIGALAIGKLAVRRLSIGKGGLRSLKIEELNVKRLRVSEFVITDTLAMPREAPYKKSENKF